MTWRPLRPLLTLLLARNLFFLSSPSVSWLRNELESPYPGACMPPRAPRGTVRWGSTTKESPFHFSLDKETKGEGGEGGREGEEDGWRTKRKKKKGGTREAVISVGRAGCIRSNIMQAHIGSLLECVRSLGSCLPTIIATARRTRRT